MLWNILTAIFTVLSMGKWVFCSWRESSGELVKLGWWNHARLRWRLDGVAAHRLHRPRTQELNKKSSKEKQSSHLLSSPQRFRENLACARGSYADDDRSTEKKKSSPKRRIKLFFSADRFSFRLRRWSNNWREEKKNRRRVFSPFCLAMDIFRQSRGKTLPRENIV